MRIAASLLAATLVAGPVAAASTYELMGGCTLPADSLGLVEPALSLELVVAAKDSAERPAPLVQAVAGASGDSVRFVATLPRDGWARRAWVVAIDAAGNRGPRSTRFLLSVGWESLAIGDTLMMTMYGRDRSGVEWKWSTDRVVVFCHVDSLGRPDAMVGAPDDVLPQHRLAAWEPVSSDLCRDWDVEGVSRPGRFARGGAFVPCNYRADLIVTALEHDTAWVRAGLDTAVGLPCGNTGTGPLPTREPVESRRPRFPVTAYPLLGALLALSVAVMVAAFLNRKP